MALPGLTTRTEVGRRIEPKLRVLGCPRVLDALVLSEHPKPRHAPVNSNELRGEIRLVLVREAMMRHKDFKRVV